MSSGSAGEHDKEGGEPYDDQIATVDQSTAVGFLLIASGGLLTLYFLIQVTPPASGLIILR